MDLNDAGKFLERVTEENPSLRGLGAAMPQVDFDNLLTIAKAGLGLYKALEVADHPQDCIMAMEWYVAKLKSLEAK